MKRLVGLANNAHKNNVSNILPFAAIAPAWKAYDEAIAPAGKAYDEAIAPARKAYHEAVAPARKAYDEAIAAALAKALKDV